MKALVTGGCGFIGSNLVKKLLAAGWEVEVVDNLSTGDITFLDGLKLRTIHTSTARFYEKEKDSRNPDVLVLVGDFIDPEITRRIVDKDYDVIFHLAADPRVEFTVNNPVETTDNNLLKTIQLMTHSIDNIRRFIFSSTCAVYGDAIDLPTPETSPSNPNSPYALQKKSVEDFGKLYYKLYKLDFISLRYFNVYGPNQFGDSAYSTAISSWCNKIKDNQPLRSDGDGSQSRDMIFVEDVASANILAANYIGEFKGECFNIGTGASITNRAILEEFKHKFSKLTIKNSPWRAGDVMHTRADISKAKEILGFMPNTSLEKGLKQTFDWWELNEE